MKLKALVAALAIGVAGVAAQAQDTGPIKIGMITDLSGVYADIDGPAGVEMVKWAVQDFGGKLLGRPIEVLSADHQNKADIGSSVARKWISEDHIAMLVGGTNSGVNLAMSKVADQGKIPIMSVGPGSARLTNQDCNAYTVHYGYDTVALANVAAKALIKQGYKTWYFLTADYAFGKSLQADATKVVDANGGKVLGSVLAPLGASDFSSFLLQAQSSKAQILALANAGGDFDNSMKAASQFGITKTMKVAGLLVFINDIHALGLKATEGLQLAAPWYWNEDAASRKFARRFFDKYHRMPSFIQAGDYSATMSWLEAAKKAGTIDGTKVMAELKKMKINDMFVKNGHIRADGLLLNDMHLYQVKTPAESQEPWDYYKLVATYPGDQAYTPLADSTCPLVKH
ncbi:MAG: Broad-specificity amino acid ABC transporter, substrate-binding protein [Burkholderiaceae bacterium]|jgi:branched-chain amino acid transport system substrate-binding protein|nr:MAG: Broad-specificity amino acid ABC transporter, substrate-binding protein [Burkholderiaceae bacterium]